ncbi:MAG TPA: PIN domain-containing protein [Thermomicrobiales bacterium]|nr:PIN domain-containing protein [Thermomicrobiales bacterium]
MTAAPPNRPVAFIDASAIVALVDGNDRSHDAARAAYRDLLAQGYRLFTTDFVIAEAFDLLRVGVGAATARAWLREQRLPVYRADEADLERAQRLLLDDQSPAERSFADAVSLAVMQRLGVADAFAVDRHFLADAPGDDEGRGGRR